MARQIQGSWIEEYLKYTDGQESPEKFHTWVALTLIASVIDRKIFLERKIFRLPTNVYVFLIAGTSKCHKSSAIGIGERILKKFKAKQDRSEKFPRIFAQKITNERLIQFLGERTDTKEGEEENDNQVKKKASGLIMASELSTFMGANAMHSGLLASLTDLYDCPDEWSYQTKSQGKDELHNVYLNMLGASTAKWLRSAIPVEAVGGGIMSRTIFVYADEPKRLIPFPEDEVPEDYDAIQDRLVNDLIHISKLEGNFSFSKCGKEWYDWFYRKNAEELMEGGKYADFFSRWDIFVLKVAMLISVSRKDELVLYEEDLKAAHSLLKEVKETMHPVLDTMVVADNQLPTAEVLKLIKRRDKMSRTQVFNMARSFASGEQIREILSTLQESGEIEAEVKGNGETIYRSLD